MLSNTGRHSGGGSAAHARGLHNTVRVEDLTVEEARAVDQTCVHGCQQAFRRAAHTAGPEGFLCEPECELVRPLRHSRRPLSGVGPAAAAVLLEQLWGGEAQIFFCRCRVVQCRAMAYAAAQLRRLCRSSTRRNSHQSPDTGDTTRHDARVKLETVTTNLGHQKDKRATFMKTDSP